MNAHLTRARFLLQELNLLADELAAQTRGSTVALFLEHLLRLRGYTPQELEAAGLLQGRLLLEEAWQEAQPDLAPWLGRGLDLEALWDRLLALQAGEPDEHDSLEGWLEDLLLVATVAPHIPGTRGEQARGRVQDCLDVLEASPSTFAAIHPALRRREDLEGTDGLHAWTRSVHARLRALPLLRLVDASPAAPPPEHLAALLAAVGVSPSPPVGRAPCVAAGQCQPMAARSRP